MHAAADLQQQFRHHFLPAKTLRFAVWQLVEGFRFRNDGGSPITDPEYEFVPSSTGIGVRFGPVYTLNDT